MVTSKEAIDYVKKNLDGKNYISMFVAGSIPNELIPQSDLDIFIIVNGEYKNKFFNNLKEIMDEFVSKNKETVYSFFRGPLKYRNKGLIHFMVYVTENNNELGTRGLFKHGLKQIMDRQGIFMSFLKTG